MRLIVVASLAACAAAPGHPAPQTNRAAEDWSALADPRLRTAPLDSVKYIALRDAYLSLGLTVRERAEATSAPQFSQRETAFELHRLQIHADFRSNSWNAFVQLEDVRAFGKSPVLAADENPVDVRQAFVMFQHDAFKLRAGRQEIAFDLQRFISLRDGPNVQQAFDGVWTAWDTPGWKLVGLASLPVEYSRDHWFDDRSSFGDRLSLIRFQRKGAVSASVYYARYNTRDILDARFVGTRAGFDWDAEAMVQSGRAWATGARAGYTIRATRIGLQLDTASSAFTPLFPNGYYFTLAGYTGYENLIHVRPSLTQRLTRDLTAMASFGLQWRETTTGAIYLHPMTPLPDTAGRGGRWTGSYLQLRSEASFGPRIVVAAEAVHYQAGSAIRAAGGGNSDYVAIEAKLAF